MSKAGRATVIHREQEVYRLLLAGAEFAEIRHYASEKDWQVGDRQIRRYMEAAYKRLAKLASRDRQQLLGRHLMQRLAIYARALKSGDLRTALQSLRDEAELERLYESPAQVVTHQMGIRVVERIIDSRAELEALNARRGSASEETLAIPCRLLDETSHPHGLEGA